MEVENIPIATTSSMNSKIGAKFLEYAVVTIDYPNKRIYFTPVNGKKITKLKNDTFYPITPNDDMQSACGGSCLPHF